MTGFTEADIRAGTIVKPEMDTLLAGLTDTQLRRIIRAVAGDQPAFAAAIEQEVKWLKMEPAAGGAGTATPAAHSIAVDVTAIRREMRKDFRRVESTGGGNGYSNHYWDDDEAGMIDPDEVLSPHWQTAEALLAAGDAAAATDVVTAMIEEWGEGITGLDEWIYEGNEEVFDETARDLGDARGISGLGHPTLQATGRKHHGCRQGKEL